MLKLAKLMPYAVDVAASKVANFLSGNEPFSLLLTLPKENGGGSLYLGEVPTTSNNTIKFGLRISALETHEYRSTLFGAVQPIQKDKDTIQISLRDHSAKASTEDDLPVDRKGIMALINQSGKEIDARLLKGENVLIHCKAGVGRSPMIAICLLLEYTPMSLPAIIRHIRSRRERITIGTERRKFIRDYIENYLPEHYENPKLFLDPEQSFPKKYQSLWDENANDLTNAKNILRDYCSGTSKFNHPGRNNRQSAHELLTNPEITTIDDLLTAALPTLHNANPEGSFVTRMSFILNKAQKYALTLNISASSDSLSDDELSMTSEPPTP
ncbi:MAG: dual specificity protein phosphatase family protein [Gammaproteobacteria bacterium]|nr:dual specificity protein phosphatase family protein [Gammaproteobacteria bacterium]